MILPEDNFRAFDFFVPNFVRPSLTVRVATADDVDAFLHIARVYEETRGGTFAEGVARYTFAGLPRSDPAIALLFHGDEAVGFSLLRLHQQPFSAERIGREDLLFILPEHRSIEADLLLHDVAHAFFDLWQPAVREMLIPATAYARDIAVRLTEVGYQPTSAAATLRPASAVVERPADSTLN